MKIAIQGHPTRGEEIIQILKSLGATSYRVYDKCSHPEWYWYINKNKEIICDPKTSIYGYKLYTLEEFKKEFPFKVGDIVVAADHKLHKITALEWYNSKLCYALDDGFHYIPQILNPYKEMNTRNITLTLDKAKEWYNKGGELKEIALQAFTKEELNPLPKSWEEYCKMYSESAMYVSLASCPKKYIALWKLELLRDCYRQGWKPDSGYFMKFCIIKEFNTYKIVQRRDISKFLSFQTHDITNEFLKNFEPLIKEAEDLI